MLKDRRGLCTQWRHLHTFKHECFVVTARATLLGLCDLERHHYRLGWNSVSFAWQRAPSKFFTGVVPGESWIAVVRTSVPFSCPLLYNLKSSPLRGSVLPLDPSLLVKNMVLHLQSQFLLRLVFGYHLVLVSVKVAGTSVLSAIRVVNFP